MAKKKFNKKPPRPKGTPPAPAPPASASGGGFSKKPKPAFAESKKHEIPQGLWTRCPKCSTLLFSRELDAYLRVCHQCQYHFPLSARERIRSLVDTGTFEEIDADMLSVDILQFTDVMPYPKRLEKHQKSTGLKDAVITGIGSMGGRRVALGVLDFGFLGGSMGSVVGERIVRLIEAATARDLPLVVISASGGARMQEGTFSLMQMAKASGALVFHARARLPFISVLTDPTMGGVLASFASMGHLIIAEPGAMIGFTGPRVFRDAAQTNLPAGFQTAEFLAERGLIDAIVSRPELKQRLCGYLNYLTGNRKSAASVTAAR